MFPAHETGASEEGKVKGTAERWHYRDNFTFNLGVVGGVCGPFLDSLLLLSPQQDGWAFSVYLTPAQPLLLLDDFRNGEVYTSEDFESIHCYI